MRLKDLIEQYGDYIIDEEELKTIIRKPPESVWELQNGDDCYVLWPSCAVTKEKFIANNSFQCMSKKSGLVFINSEDAYREKYKREVETMLLKYGGDRNFIPYGNNYIVSMLPESEDISIQDCAGVNFGNGVVYFHSLEQIETALNESGADIIKEGYFE